jgi:Domain of unknown function (DUF5658)
MCFARLPHGAITIFVVAIFSTAVVAAQENSAPPDEPATALTESMAAIQSSPVAAPVVRASEPRPAALVPLYASFIALQLLDLHSTHAAVTGGAVEANPALAGFAGNTLAMAAVKAAGTAGVIFCSEKIRAKNKVAALGLMIAANSAMTWVVQHNYRLAP